MKVLVIGSGGREHALSWKLAQSPKVSDLYVAPGNPGTARCAENVALAADDISGIVSFAKEKGIDLTVVGPEYPLTLGLVDALQQEGLRVFGPSKAAAAMEGSKHFAKEVMEAAGVPTARFQTFSKKEDASAYAQELGAPLVLKADGLAAGKGVVVCLKEQEVVEGLDFIFDELKAEKLVIEEYLEGVEASYIAACDGELVVPLAHSHDYKRIFEDDQGPNTGGMGTVSPSPRLSAEMEQQVLESVMRPVVQELSKRGVPFRGFLFAGLMIQPDGAVKVLEFNVRLGDPEGQVILRRMKSDLFDLLYALSSDGQESLPAMSWDERTAVCVVLASAGYPQSSSKGDEIHGVDQAEQFDSCVVFHAGTAVKNGSLVTAGGRVLNATALGESLSGAIQNAYRAADMIQFPGRQLRRDIGQ